MSGERGGGSGAECVPASARGARLHPARRALRAARTARGRAVTRAGEWEGRQRSPAGRRGLAPDNKKKKTPKKRVRPVHGATRPLSPPAPPPPPPPQPRRPGRRKRRRREGVGQSLLQRGRLRAVVAHLLGHRRREQGAARHPDRPRADRRQSAGLDRGHRQRRVRVRRGVRHRVAGHPAGAQGEGVVAFFFFGGALVFFQTADTHATPLSPPPNQPTRAPPSPPPTSRPPWRPKPSAATRRR